MAGPPPFALVRAARLPIAVGAALALADASVVTLALPEILAELDTTVEGLAAVIGVYTVVLAVAVLVAIPARRALGSRITGALGMLLFAVASVLCGVSDTLTGLLVWRGVQAVGAGLGLLAAFELLDRGSGGGAGDRTVAAARPGTDDRDDVPRRRSAPLWVAAAIFGTAIGPALGGALTQAFDWRAIFLAQAPFGLLAAAACLVPQRSSATGSEEGDGAADGGTSGAGPGAADAPAWRLDGTSARGTGTAPAGGSSPAGPSSTWPVPPARGARSTARPAGHEDPTRVFGTGEDDTLIDPAGGPRRASDPDGP
ncbi:MFS transporter, partial [Patulibacter sp.]|uniref:MFS transporter n=1 Tax=Patulibacter sp. TaxID=1912859 RepID=UPI0027181DD7